MYRKKIRSEVILNLLEQMIDARFKMMMEKRYENHLEVQKIKDNIYEPITKKIITELDRIGIDFNSGKGYD